MCVVFDRGGVSDVGLVDRRSLITGSIAGVLFPMWSWADGSPIHPFVNERPINSRIQALGLHGVLLTIVPVLKAAPITVTRDSKSRQGTARASLRTGDSTVVEPELSTRTIHREWRGPPVRGMAVKSCGSVCGSR